MRGWLCPRIWQAAHGPFALRADCQQAQARRVRGGTEAVEEIVERARCLHHPCITMLFRGYVDVFISLVNLFHHMVRRGMGSLARTVDTI